MLLGLTLNENNGGISEHRDALSRGVIMGGGVFSSGYGFGLGGALLSYKEAKREVDVQGEDLVLVFTSDNDYCELFGSGNGNLGNVQGSDHGVSEDFQGSHLLHHDVDRSWVCPCSAIIKKGGPRGPLIFNLSPVSRTGRKRTRLVFLATLADSYYNGTTPLFLFQPLVETALFFQQ